MIVDWTQLHHRIVLHLEREGLYWVACDGDTVYMRHPNLLEVTRWMRRMALTEPDVTVDERSVSDAYTEAAHAAQVVAAAWADAQAHSVRVAELDLAPVIPLIRKDAS